MALVFSTSHDNASMFFLPSFVKFSFGVDILCTGMTDRWMGGLTDDNEKSSFMKIS